jgi:hypothetical protein
MNDDPEYEYDPIEDDVRFIDAREAMEMDDRVPDGAAEREWRFEGGWGMVSPKGHWGHRGGLVGQRDTRRAVRAGDLPSQWDDHQAALDWVGVSVDEIRLLYGGRRGGPLPQDLRSRRDAIDRRLAYIRGMPGFAADLGVPELEKSLRRGRRRGATREMFDAMLGRSTKP